VKSVKLYILLPRDAMHNLLYDVCPTVCLFGYVSVCLLNANILSKRLNISSHFFH